MTPLARPVTKDAHLQDRVRGVGTAAGGDLMAQLQLAELPVSPGHRLHRCRAGALVLLSEHVQDLALVVDRSYSHMRGTRIFTTISSRRQLPVG
jgi:hypothetical protein